MKILIVIIVTLLAAAFFYASNDTVVETSNVQFETNNPLRGAPSLVSLEANSPVDFSELHVPFSRDSEGTEIAGELRVDENGDLIIDGQLKSYFDYFLSSVGEVTPEHAIRRLHLLFSKHLSESAAKQAMKSLEGYLAYKEASFDFLAQPLEINNNGSDAEYRFNKLAYALDGLKDLRREFMDESAATEFYKEDESFADYTLETQRVALDTGLTILEKRELRAQARASMPEDMANIAEEQETRAYKQQGLQQLIRDDVSVDDIALYAYENFSAEEAESIVNHHRDESQMKLQYAVYREKVSLLQDQGLSGDELNQAQIDLANQYFNEEQVTIVQAWDIALVQ